MDSSQRGSHAPRIVVERYLDEVLNGRSVAAIGELISDRTLKQRVVAFRSAFPDSCPPTGRCWTTTCTAIYRVERGRIADSWIKSTGTYWRSWDSSSAFGAPRP